MTELPAHPDTEPGRPEPGDAAAGAPIRPGRLTSRGKALAAGAVVAVIVLIGVLHLTGVVGK
jgi:hypothetical protein